MYCQGGSSELWPLCLNTKSLIACFCWVSSTSKCLKFCTSMTVLGCMQVCTPQRLSVILDRQCCHIHLRVLTLLRLIITCLNLWKRACRDTITPVMRHYRMPCVGGCRGGRATFTEQEYMLLLEGWRRLAMKMEITLKNNCAFSSAVVKFHTILTCHLETAWIKKYWLLLSDCFLSQCSIIYWNTVRYQYWWLMSSR